MENFRRLKIQHSSNNLQIIKSKISNKKMEKIKMLKKINIKFQ